MPDDRPFPTRRTLRAQIQEAEYEITMRRKVYPRLKGPQARQAEEHMLRMECVVETLHWLDFVFDGVPASAGELREALSAARRRT